MIKPEMCAQVLMFAFELFEESWNGKVYTRTHDHAASEACATAGIDLKWAGPMSLLMLTACNDVQLWANSIR